LLSISIGLESSGTATAACNKASVIKACLLYCIWWSVLTGVVEGRQRSKLANFHQKQAH